MSAADTHEPTMAALVPINRQEGNLVRPAATLEVIEEAFRAYAALCDRLLEQSDFQRIGNKDFRKKSAWRKLSVAYGVSSELISESEVRNDQGRIIRAKVVMRAMAPNGRYSDGIGICDVFEKCCDRATCKNSSQYHNHCATDCRGVIHFSNPEHDLPATAMTRATNRAQSDLFGLGEVSAEEITDKERQREETRSTADWYAENGWTDEAEHTAWYAGIKAVLTDLPPERQAEFKDWRTGSGLPLARANKAQAEALSAKASEMASSGAEDATADPTEVVDQAEGRDGGEAEPGPPVA